MQINLKEMNTFNNDSVGYMIKISSRDKTSSFFSYH